MSRSTPARQQDLGALHRMVRRPRVHLVVEVVQHPGDAPPLDVLAVALGVRAHRGLHGPGVLAQAIALRELGEQRPGLRRGSRARSCASCRPSRSTVLRSASRSASSARIRSTSCSIARLTGSGRSVMFRSMPLTRWPSLYVTRPGTPTTTALGGTSRTTTEPAPDPAVLADRDGADDLGAGADGDVVAQRGMALLAPSAGAAQRHALQQADVRRRPRPSRRSRCPCRGR